MMHFSREENNLSNYNKSIVYLFESAAGVKNSQAKNPFCPPCIRLSSLASWKIKQKMFYCVGLEFSLKIFFSEWQEIRCLLRAATGDY